MRPNLTVMPTVSLVNDLGDKVKKVLLVLAILFVALGGIGSCAAVMVGTAVKESTTPTPDSPASPPSIVETPAPAPKTEAPKATPGGVTDGMYIVGTDLPAGRYRSPGAAPSDFPGCSVYVEGPTGSMEDVEYSNSTTQSVIFTVIDGQTVSIDGCQAFVKI